MEDEGVNREGELSRSKDVEHEIKKKQKACKDHKKLSEESALFENGCEMLVEKSKKKHFKDVLMFQNEEHLEEKQARQEVDSDFFGH